MATDENLRLMSRLIRDNVPGTEGLYSKVPFVLRVGLNNFIKRIPWCKYDASSHQSDAAEETSRLYNQLLQEIDKFIEQKVNQSVDGNALCDNSTLMRLAKYDVQNMFQGDESRFVKELSECLRKETSLINAHSDAEMDLVPSVLSPSQTSKSFETSPALDQELAEYENLLRKIKQYDTQPLQDILQDISLQDLHSFEALQGINSHSPSRDLDHLLKQLDRTMNILEQDMSNWTDNEGSARVNLSQHANTDVFNNRCSKVLSIIVRSKHHVAAKSMGLNDSQLVQYQAQISSLLERFFTCALIVSRQPKTVYMIEPVDDDETAYRLQSGQIDSISLRLLGTEPFSNQNIIEATANLVSDKELSEQETDGCTKQNDSHQSIHLDMGHYVLHNGDTFWELKLKESFHLNTSCWYMEFFRLRFRVVVEFQHTQCTLETFSQPFTFCKDGDHKLYNIGALMWNQEFSNKSERKFQCPESVSVENVVNMLAKRVGHMTANHRTLTEDDKRFLHSRIPVLDSGLVSMQEFLIKHLPDGDVSFYTWFHGVINCLSSPALAKPWKDGIIYGLCDEKYAQELLTGRADGTFLLRLSKSKVENSLSESARTMLTMNMKLKPTHCNRRERFKSIPLTQEHLDKYGVYTGLMITEIGSKQQITRFICTADGEISPFEEKLRVYATGDRKNGVSSASSGKTFVDYKVVVENMTTLQVQDTDDEDRAAKRKPSESDLYDESQLMAKNRMSRSSVGNPAHALDEFQKENQFGDAMAYNSYGASIHQSQVLSQSGASINQSQMLSQTGASINRSQVLSQTGASINQSQVLSQIPAAAKHSEQESYELAESTEIICNGSDLNFCDTHFSATDNHVIGSKGCETENASSSSSSDRKSLLPTNTTNSVSEKIIVRDQIVSVFASHDSITSNNTGFVEQNIDEASLLDQTNFLSSELSKGSSASGNSTKLSQKNHTKPRDRSEYESDTLHVATKHTDPHSCFPSDPRLVCQLPTTLDDAKEPSKPRKYTPRPTVHKNSPSTNSPSTRKIVINNLRCSQQPVLALGIDCPGTSDTTYVSLPVTQTNGEQLEPHLALANDVYASMSDRLTDLVRSADSNQWESPYQEQHEQEPEVEIHKTWINCHTSDNTSRDVTNASPFALGGSQTNDISSEDQEFSEALAKFSKEVHGLKSLNDPLLSCPQPCTSDEESSKETAAPEDQLNETMSDAIQTLDSLIESPPSTTISLKLCDPNDVQDLCECDTL